MLQFQVLLAWLVRTKDQSSSNCCQDQAKGYWHDEPDV